MTSLSLGTGFLEDCSTGRFLFSRLNFLFAPAPPPALRFLQVVSIFPTFLGTQQGFRQKLQKWLASTLLNLKLAERLKSSASYHSFGLALQCHYKSLSPTA